MRFLTRTPAAREVDLDALLARADDPPRTLRIIIQELEDTLVETRTATVHALARQREIERHAARLGDEAAEWHERAALALDHGREDLARAALDRRRRLTDEAAKLTEGLATATEDVAGLEDALAQVREKLADARRRQRLMTLSIDAGRARAHGQAKFDAAVPATEVAFDALAAELSRLRAEGAVAGVSADPDAPLAARLDRLARDSALDAELAALRARRTPAPPTPPLPVPDPPSGRTET